MPDFAKEIIYRSYLCQITSTLKLYFRKLKMEIYFFMHFNVTREIAETKELDYNYIILN